MVPRYQPYQVAINKDEEEVEVNGGWDSSDGEKDTSHTLDKKSSDDEWDWNKQDNKQTGTGSYMPWGEPEVKKKQREYKPWKFKKKEKYSDDDSDEEVIVTTKYKSKSIW